MATTVPPGYASSAEPTAEFTGLSQSEVAETLRSFGGYPREIVEQFFS